MDFVVNFLILILLHLFFLGSRTACLQKTIYSLEKESCLITCKNHCILPESITLVSLANIIRIGEVIYIDYEKQWP
jgi:hypothetical protein